MHFLKTLLLSFLTAGLFASCMVTRVGALRYTIKARDGYPLIAYDIIKAGRHLPPAHPRGVFIYMQGSLFEPVVRNIDQLATVVLFGARAILIEKRGCYTDSVSLQEAFRYAGKPTRVSDVVTVLDSMLSDLPAGTPVVMMGGSEGGDIAAAVAAAYPRISHLILVGAGGGISQKQEFRYIVSRAPGSFGCRNVAQLDSIFTVIEHAQDSMKLWLGYPYKRWQTYALDSSLKYLKDLSIPVLLIHGAEDESVPVISARSLDSALRAGGKSNLTYIEYPGVNHELVDVHDHKSRYPYLEADLARWFERLGLISRLEAEIFLRRLKARHRDIF